MLSFPISNSGNSRLSQCSSVYQPEIPSMKLGLSGAATQSRYLVDKPHASPFLNICEPSWTFRNKEVHQTIEWNLFVQFAAEVCDKNGKCRSMQSKTFAAKKKRKKLSRSWSITWSVPALSSTPVYSWVVFSFTRCLIQEIPNQHNDSLNSLTDDLFKSHQVINKVEMLVNASLLNF